MHKDVLVVGAPGRNSNNGSVFTFIKINNNTVHFDGIDIKITSSGGVAFSTETETSADLTNKADERLYEAKKSGRNRFKLIDTELVGD